MPFFTPELLQPRRRARDARGPSVGAVAEIENGMAAAEGDRQLTVSCLDVLNPLERNHQAGVAAEPDLVLLENRRALEGPAVQRQRARGVISHRPPLQSAKL